MKQDLFSINSEFATLKNGEFFELEIDVPANISLAPWQKYEKTVKAPVKDDKSLLIASFWSELNKKWFTCEEYYFDLNSRLYMRGGLQAFRRGSEIVFRFLVDRTDISQSQQANNRAFKVKARILAFRPPNL